MTLVLDRPNLAYPRGVLMELHPSPDYISDVIRDTGDFYEAAILDEIARRVTGGVLVDVGAMIGNHTAYLAAFVPNDGIHAFEPIKTNRRLLQRNLGAYPGMFVHAVALSDSEGIAGMTIDPDNLGHAVISPTGSVAVRTRTLDSYALPDVSLIKIDVEGHEPAVLRGATDTIARCKPLIVIEDWQRAYAPLLPGYRLVAEWETAHQTFMYEAVA